MNPISLRQRVAIGSVYQVEPISGVGRNDSSAPTPNGFNGLVVITSMDFDGCLWVYPIDVRGRISDSGARLPIERFALLVDAGFWKYVDEPLDDAADLAQEFERREAELSAFRAK